MCRKWRVLPFNDALEVVERRIVRKRTCGAELGSARVLQPMMDYCPRNSCLEQTQLCCVQ